MLIYLSIYLSRFYVPSRSFNESSRLIRLFFLELVLACFESKRVRKDELLFNLTEKTTEKRETKESARRFEVVREEETRRTFSSSQDPTVSIQSIPPDLIATVLAKMSILPSPRTPRLSSASHLDPVPRRALNSRRRADGSGSCCRRGIDGRGGWRWGWGCGS